MNTIDQLRKYDKLYYNTGKSPISDTEYDKLKSNAKMLFPNDPYFNEVGFVPVSNKTKLPFVLGSLNKTKPNGSFNKWCNKLSQHNFIITPKLDGMTILVKYNNGLPVLSYQRGNGEIGTDITEKSKKFCPETEYKDEFWVRGEIVLTGNIHKEIGYKTRRNAVAGILNRKDGLHLDKLTVIYYEVVDPFNESESVRLDFLNNYFPDNSVQYISLPFKLINEVCLIKLYSDMRKDYITDIDGLVIKIDDLDEREDIKYPEYAVAFKVNEEGISTIVKDIVWNTTRTGRVVPVVHIEPTEIDGVTVNKVTGYNAEFIETSGINIGSEIKVLRSGGVIPMITEVVITKEVSLPNTCFYCGGNLKRKGVDLVCTNPECSNQSYSRLEYYLTSLGAENITEKTLKRIGLSDIQSLYELDEFELSEIDGIGLKKASSIVNEIQKTLSTSPDKLLTAFGINGISIENSRNILKVYDFEELFTITENRLLEIEGIGEVLSKNIVSEIGKYKDVYEYLKSIGLKWKSNSNKLKGKNVVLTGSCELVKRDDIVKMIESNGGYFKKSISKKVDLLVVGDINTNSSKAKKARQYNINIITYDELFVMLGE
jgi:DNA ligase (NAD+)